MKADGGSDHITTTQNNVFALGKERERERKSSRKKFAGKSSLWSISVSAKLHRLLITDRGPVDDKERRANSVTWEYENNHHSWLLDDT